MASFRNLSRVSFCGNESAETTVGTFSNVGIDIVFINDYGFVLLSGKVEPFQLIEDVTDRVTDVVGHLRFVGKQVVGFQCHCSLSAL